MTINLGELYRAIAAILDEAGLREVAYSLDIEWWSHGHRKATSPELSVYVQWPDQDSTIYVQTTPGEILVAIERDAQKYRQAPPTPPATPEVEVVL